MQNRNVRKLTSSEIELVEQAATSVEVLETEYMENRIFDLSMKAAGDGEERLADTYRFLAGVLRPGVEAMSDIDSSANQFWVIPKTLSDDEIQLLQDIVAQSSDPELRSRFEDYLWLRTRDRKYGERAVDDYLDSARRLRDPEDWTGCAGRYERAVELAARLGKRNERYARCIEIIEEYLAELNGEDPLFLSERLMSILLNQKKGDGSRYAALAETCAIAAEKRANFYLALHYWNLKARWRLLSNDVEGEREARIAAAESVVKDGESRIKGESPSYLTAASLVQKGLVMLQKAGAQRVRIDEVALQLKEYQTKGLTELKRVGSTFDATEIVNEARSSVANKSLPEALNSFAALPYLPGRDATRRQVLKRAKRYVFSHIFGEVRLNREGAAVSGRGTVSGDETEETRNVLALMYQDVIQGFNIQAQTTIEPAWRQIQDDHHVREQDMESIAIQSWFVPPRREIFFARGLIAGFKGDLITAAHLLVPQIEPAIRWHLQQRGVNTMRLNRDGFQEERDLNQLLAMRDSKMLLGDSLHFGLSAILINRFGPNLRNDLAHGRLEVADCYSFISLFFWALVLTVCIRTIPASEGS